MKTIEKYMKKNAEKMNAVQTSVSIESKQKDFVDANNLNLSEMVRDMLSSMMNASKPRKSA